DRLNRRLTESALPISIVQSVQKQSTRLAAIEISTDQDANERHSLRRAVDDAFVSGFKAVMIGGALLAAASALTAVFLIKTPTRL
ncbi:MAG TPA: hypothetical protein VLK27_05045, partial [Chthoniobacterales bacterium]|nr:hypothetical protein [Chthoniobacterales bacterium]